MTLCCTLTYTENLRYPCSDHVGNIMDLILKLLLLYRTEWPIKHWAWLYRAVFIEILSKVTQSVVE